MASSSSRFLVPGVCAVVVILVALAAIQQMNQQNDSVAISNTTPRVVEEGGKPVVTPVPTETTPVPTPVTDTTPTPTTKPEPAPAVAAHVYKDGTYTATGSYMSPAGSETILVTLTVQDDKIASATVVPQATRPASVNWQNTFVFGYQTLVLGKNIDEVHLGKVSGASLTPKGFNDALAKIKSDAKV